MLWMLWGGKEGGSEGNEEGREGEDAVGRGRVPVLLGKKDTKDRGREIGRGRDVLTWVLLAVSPMRLL